MLAVVAVAVVGLRCLAFVQSPAATHARPSERPPAIGRDFALRGGGSGLRRTSVSTGTRVWAVASFLGAFLFGCSVAMQPAAAIKSIDDFSQLWADQFAPLQSALFKAEQRAAEKKEERKILEEAEYILKAMEIKEKSIAEKKPVPKEAAPPVELQDLATLKKEEQAAKVLEQVVEDLESKASPEEKKLLEAVDQEAKAEEDIIKQAEANKEAREKKQDEKPSPPPAEKKADEAAEKPVPPAAEKKAEEEPAEKPVPPPAEKKAEEDTAEKVVPPPADKKAEEGTAEKPVPPPAATEPPVEKKPEKIQTPEEAAAILKQEKKVEAVLEEKLAQALKEEKEAKAEAEAIRDRFLEETEVAAKTAGAK